MECLLNLVTSVTLGPRKPLLWTGESCHIDGGKGCVNLPMRSMVNRFMEKACNTKIVPIEPKAAILVGESEARDHYREDVRTLAGKLLTVQDEERRRISRDLHDDVNQRLGAIGLQLDSLSRNLPNSPTAVRRRIRSIRRHVSELSDDVRELAYRFHQTTVEDLGLVAALQRYLNDFVKRTGISARFTKPQSADSIPPRLATCLYRIAQESLGNVGLHAKASQVSVALTVSLDAVSLTVWDDGIGMDIEEVRRRREGLGMLSMEERANLLNGSVSWHSSPGQGTSVIAQFAQGLESP